MSRPLLVYLPGVSREAIAGTDHHLAESLAAIADVLWVDPPRWPLNRRGESPPSVAAEEPGIYRLQPIAPPGATRPGLRRLAQIATTLAVRRCLERLDREAQGVVVANPMATFPAGVNGRRLYFATDDWPAGASLMGLSRAHIESNQRRQVAHADVVASVSPALSALLAEAHGRYVHVVPNGCAPTRGHRPGTGQVDGGERRAGLVGQINERLDLGLVEAVADRGVSLVIVGPLAARDAEFVERFTELAGRPNVAWLGAQPRALVPALLSRMTVGLTPYTESSFNRSSFPLKTLEYLGAGLRCVATPLPAHEWLDTELVTLARDPSDFAARVEEALSEELDQHERLTRIDFAEQHSWRSRALEMGTLLGLRPGSADEASNDSMTTKGDR